MAFIEVTGSALKQLERNMASRNVMLAKQALHDAREATHGVCLTPAGRAEATHNISQAKDVLREARRAAQEGRPMNGTDMLRLSASIRMLLPTEPEVEPAPLPTSLATPTGLDWLDWLTSPVGGFAPLTSYVAGPAPLPSPASVASVASPASASASPSQPVASYAYGIDWAKTGYVANSIADGALGVVDAAAAVVPLVKPIAMLGRWIQSWFNG